MHGGMPLGLRRRQSGLPVQMVFEDGEHRFARERADRDGTGAGGFEPVFPVFPGQAQQAQAGAIAHLGMALVGELVFDDGRDAGTDRRRPVQQATRCPFEVRAVCRRHVVFDGAVVATT